MDIESVREYALALEGASERMPFGPDFVCIEVAGHMFVMLFLGDGRTHFYNVKAAPQLGRELRERYTAVSPGWHMNKKYWLSVEYAGDMPDAEQRELIRHSYAQVLAAHGRKRRNAPGAS